MESKIKNFEARIICCDPLNIGKHGGQVRRMAEENAHSIRNLGVLWVTSKMSWCDTCRLACRKRFCEMPAPGQKLLESDSSESSSAPISSSDESTKHHSNFEKIIKLAGHLKISLPEKQSLFNCNSQNFRSTVSLEILLIV